MSETAPEGGGGGGGGNVFTKKLGPLPMWGWMGIALLIAVLYYLYRKNKAASSATSTAQTAATNNTPGGVDSSLVPQFVNQVYNQESPPVAPNVTVNKTINSNDTNSNDTSSGNTTTTNNPPPHPPSAPPTQAGPLNEILQKGHAISLNPGNAEIGWTIAQKSPNATQLLVTLAGPGVAKGFQRTIPASATTATFKDLEPGHTYVATVTPMDSAGQAVGGPNHVTFVTSKS